MSGAHPEAGQPDYQSSGQQAILPGFVRLRVLRGWKSNRARVDGTGRSRLQEEPLFKAPPGIQTGGLRKTRPTF